MYNDVKREKKKILIRKFIGKDTDIRDHEEGIISFVARFCDLIEISNCS